MTAVTILSDDGRHKAVVTATDDGARAEYFRAVISNGHAVPAHTMPTADAWRFLRAANISQPFHRALDTAHDVVNAL